MAPHLTPWWGRFRRSDPQVPTVCYHCKMGMLETVCPRDIDRGALQFIAEGVTELAGFEMAAISVVHEGLLHTVAVAGERVPATELERIKTPVDLLLAELELAEDWGPLKFVPHENEGDFLADYSYIPDMVVSDAPNAWHPHDLLCALLTDDAGTLRGVLSIDLPRNGLRPDHEQRRIIEVYARQAGRAVITALERRELEQGLRREQAVAEFRGKLIDVFSHQLQNPVAAISGNLELLLDDLPEGDPSERSLLAIERATRRITLMIEDLLVLARVNNPERSLKAIDVDLVGLLREELDLLTTDADRKEVAVELVTPQDELLVSGDAGELGDLVSNLVSNAVKYSDPGGRVTAAVDRALSPSGDRFVELTIQDRGIGIAPEDQMRLFEEFFRSERLEVRSRPGTGLGLAIVDRVVRRHGGRIDVESELGVGTTVRVRLPG